MVAGEAGRASRPLTAAAASWASLPLRRCKPESGAEPAGPETPSSSLAAVTARLVVVGGGRMGEALLTGLLDAGWANLGELAVVEKIAGRRDELAATYPGLRVVAERVRGRSHRRASSSR